MLKVDWLQIKSEYVNTTISQRDLAKKYCISDSTLTKKANKEKWQQLRQQNNEKVATKVQRKIQEQTVKKIASNIELINSAATGLLETLVTATKQIKDRDLVNTQNLKQLTAALRDLKCVQDYDVKEQGSGNIEVHLEGEIEEWAK